MSSPKKASTRLPQGRIFRWIGETWLKAFGWTVEGGVPAVSKAVIVAAPHTSNWDFPFTVATSFALGLRIHYLGKHTLFKPPYGVFMRWLGGIPVNRTRRNDLVSSAVEIMNQYDELYLIVPPEGTRSRTERWKTGFYYIACGAKVPIVLGFLDFEKKRAGLGELFYPTGDIEADMAKIRAFYADIKGKHPERMSEITLGAQQPRVAEAVGA